VFRQYEKKEKRRFLRYYLITLVLTIGAVFFILLSIVVVIAATGGLELRSVFRGNEFARKDREMADLFVLVASVPSVLYRYGSGRTQARWYCITWGSASASVAWLAASVLFSWYVANFGSYDKIYGSFGAIIVLWLGSGSRSS
jgi:membrane protein